MARDRGAPHLACQLLVVPVTDYAFDTASYRENAEGYVLTRNIMIWCWNHYLANENDGMNPYASPLRAKNFRNLPPAFILVAAMNPCQCGYYGDPIKEYTCSLTNVLRYQKRISGPLLDRIDIHIEVPRVEYEKFAGDRTGESSAKIRERVKRARAHQRKRFAGTTLQCNGDMGPAEVRMYCVVDDAGKNLLRAAMQQLQMSARAFHRTQSVKLARTIADLAENDQIETPHLAEAIQYRPRKQA